MAISLSELTGASTSGNVLNEVNSYADFLDSCPRLLNKADPSGATDATQTTATKQPVALPLIDGDGYLFCSGIYDNYAQTPNDNSLDITGDLVIDVDVTMKSWSPTFNSSFCGRYVSSGDQRSFRFLLRTDKKLQVYFSEDGTAAGLSGAISPVVPFSDNQRGQVRFVFNSSTGVVQFFTSTNKGVTWTQLGSDSSTGKSSIHSGTADLYIGCYDANSELLGNAAIHSVKLYDSITPSSSSLRFNCDFNSSKIPHGASEFLSDSGHQVRVITSGNNPSKVIKKAVLRFDGSDDGLKGFFENTISEGYMFAAFSVLGNGGETSARVFSINSTGDADYNNTGSILSAIKGLNLSRYAPGVTWDTLHAGMSDDDNGDILHEIKIQSNAQLSRVNNADEATRTTSITAVNAEEFNIGDGSPSTTTSNASIDLEYLAVFPATLTDSQADQIRNFINNRNKVFYRWDTDGYYFFDGAATDDGQVFTGSGSWNGRIVGSDNGDTDFYISQNTLDDRPTSDGYKITFADNTDHFDIPSTTQAGWQIVGTSLGTFAYKVNGTTAVTELNLLGNVGSASYRQIGDLYGIILLPESATARDIEEARKLLIDRGAADASTIISAGAAWFRRYDIIEFKNAEFPDAVSLGFAFEEATNLRTINTVNAPLSTNFSSAWKDCSSLTSFPADSKLGTETNYVNFNNAWRSSGLTSFPALDLSNGNNFTNAWRDASSLTEISSGLQLGTNPAYTGVSFTRAWQGSGLTSFPALDLSNGNSFDNAWQGCTSLQSFPEDALLGTEASNVNFSAAWQSSGLKSFSTPLPTAINCTEAWKTTPITSFNLTSLPEVEQLYSSFQSCTQLTSFSTAILKSKRMLYCWRSCSSLTDFSAAVFANWNPSVINDRCFDQAWYGCTSLTAQSVENILVPIAASGKWATNTGLEGGTALTDATIDIDYKAVDPNNSAITYPLTAATLTAIETLNGRGWSVNINNEIIVPNILQLQPAAAYSLRSFDADADPTVVNVRRSSDGSLSDFTASQVSDGTLTSWVNNVVTISPTLNNGGFEDGATGWSFGTNASLDTTVSHSGSNSAKLNVVGGANSSITKQSSTLEVGRQMTVGFWARISDTSKNLKVYIGGNIHVVSFTSTDWEYNEITRTVNTTTELSFGSNASSGDYTIHIDDITVTNLTADGYVTTWYDQSGSGNNSTQSTASSQPLIVENGVLVTENGEAALSFDGANDYLDKAFTLSDVFSQFVVASHDTGSDFIIDGITVNSASLWTYDGNQVRSLINNLLYQNAASGSRHLYSASNNLTEQYFKVDNQTASTATGGARVVGGVSIGASANGALPLLGNIQEVVLFDTDQSVQRTGIEKNINDHFGIY